MHRENDVRVHKSSFLFSCLQLLLELAIVIGFRNNVQRDEKLLIVGSSQHNRAHYQVCRAGGLRGTHLPSCSFNDLLGDSRFPRHSGFL